MPETRMRQRRGVLVGGWGAEQPKKVDLCPATPTMLCLGSCAFAEQDPPMTTHEQPAVCTLDCPDTCSLTVTVDRGRITKVRGSDALPLTSSVICNKVA